MLPMRSLGANVSSPAAIRVSMRGGSFPARAWGGTRAARKMIAAQTIRPVHSTFRREQAGAPQF
jgi:hypothetical protein